MAILLSMLWEHYAKSLAASLRVARVTAAIPPSGGVLAFVGGLAKCIVLEYEFAGLTPRFDAVAVIDQPRSAFDFWGAIDHATPSARNSLKRILASGHKILYHRGVLTHVDRRADVGVFGPSIDTIVMSELLPRKLYDDAAPHPIRSALEVGCGSGLLSCNVAQHLVSLEALIGIDSDSRAVACTERNLRIARTSSGAPPKGTHLITGRFTPGLLNRTFDLLICNPPYIPLLPDDAIPPMSRSEYFPATGGLELLSDLLSSLKSLLNPNGKALVMLSSLCIKQVAGLLPADFSVYYPFGPDGFDVIFDVEDVLTHERWLEHLKKDGALRHDPGSDILTHRLHPVWLERN
jgi:methylase of polypeptide subunit release factors